MKQGERRQLRATHLDPPEGLEGLALVCAAVDAGTRGVPSVMKAVPAPAKDTASVKLASAAKGAATAKLEALEPWVGGEAGHGHGRDKAQRDGAAERKHGVR